MLNCSEAMKLMLYHVTVATFQISLNFINSTHIHTIQTITFEQSQSNLNAVSIETVCHSDEVSHLSVFLNESVK